jgi:hypothetical protein
MDLELWKEHKGEVLGYAAIGAAIAAFYKMSQVYTTRVYPLQKLRPPPEAFHVDPAASHLFARLQAARRVDEKHYLEAFHATDSLLHLEHQLQRYLPLKSDERRAAQYRETASLALFRLGRSYVRRSKKKPSAAACEEFEQTRKQIDELLWTHLQNVNRLRHTLYRPDV